MKMFIISDLHLGGAEGFQMCSAKGRSLLADFIDWVSDQHTDKTETRLVIAGDIVDFLAEREPTGGFTAFSQTEEIALGKLNRILNSTAEVWDALARLCASEVRLTLMLGNHDIELAFPALRARLRSRLGGRPIEFLFDNEAFSAGALLVEHGNRYDGFNQVDHDGLRRLRSHFSRRETPRDALAVQPGSQMVAEVMNRIKEKYAFVDLLKPETAGVVPILAALDGGIWRKFGAVVMQAAEAWYRGSVDHDGVPKRRELIAATAGPVATTPTADLPDRDVFALADELSVGAHDEKVSWISDQIDDFKLSSLLRAFRKRKEKDGTTFEIGQESEVYLRPAGAAALRGFQVVVMGHSHLAKSVTMPAGGTYLNTGTWADLMCLPDSVYGRDEDMAKAALKGFLADIKANRIDKYRCQVPTFAEIDVDGKVATGRVQFYDGKGHVEALSTKGMWSRLGVKG